MERKQYGATLISERQFADGFSSFWSGLLPFLTPACVTVFNQSHGLDIDGGKSVDDEVLLSKSLRLPADILSEAAFEMARSANHSNSAVRDIFHDEAERVRSWEAAVAKVSRYREIIEIPCPDRKSSVGLFFERLSMRYDAFSDYAIDMGAVTYSPRVAGCGFLAESEADVCIGSTLFEVKTVSRNFASKDIKQIIIYLALDHCSGSRRWNQGGFFNPRRNRIALFDPNKFLPYVSGGKSAVSIYHEIEDFLGSREVQIESRF